MGRPRKNDPGCGSAMRMVHAGKNEGFVGRGGEVVVVGCQSLMKPHVVEDFKWPNLQFNGTKRSNFERLSFSLLLIVFFMALMG